MDIFLIGSRERETYSVELKYSLLWEAALGIAAITNDALVETLDLTKEEREMMKASFSPELKKHLKYVKEHNTWKTLLQLLHKEDFNDIPSFVSFLKGLSDEEFKSAVIPYLGMQQEELTAQLVLGSHEALVDLQDKIKGNSFLPDYLGFIFKTDPQELKDHLATVLSEWVQAVVVPKEKEILAVLERDIESKQRMKEKLNPEQFVEFATDGIKYLPEPSVFKVILIPHFFYRPWNVEADLKGTKVFYYPVANESLSPDSKYIPNKMMVQKYKALGDETRLKILKMITERPRSLQELTNELEMGKTTVHHHLKILKSARLVSDSLSKYSTNVQSLNSLDEELQLFLKME